MAWEDGQPVPDLLVEERGGVGLERQPTDRAHKSLEVYILDIQTYIFTHKQRYI